MLSPTERCGNSASDWNTMPRLRLCVGIGVMSWPSRMMAPAVGSSRPAIMRRSVVLPQPDGPSRQTNLPSGTDRLTLPTALVTSLMASPDMLFPAFLSAKDPLTASLRSAPLPHVHGGEEASIA